jgi:hypothetical protein
MTVGGGKVMRGLEIEGEKKVLSEGTRVPGIVVPEPDIVIKLAFARFFGHSGLRC